MERPRGPPETEGVWMAKRNERKRYSGDCTGDLRNERVYRGTESVMVWYAGDLIQRRVHVWDDGEEVIKVDGDWMRLDRRDVDSASKREAGFEIQWSDVVDHDLVVRHVEVLYARDALRLAKGLFEQGHGDVQIWNGATGDFIMDVDESTPTY